MPSCLADRTLDWKSLVTFLDALFTDVIKEWEAALTVAVFSWQFNFLNCFASLFYIAFVLMDMKLLRQVSEHNGTVSAF